MWCTCVMMLCLLPLPPSPFPLPSHPLPSFVLNQPVLWMEKANGAPMESLFAGGRGPIAAMLWGLDCAFLRMSLMGLFLMWGLEWREGAMQPAHLTSVLHAPRTAPCATQAKHAMPWALTS